MQAVRETRDLTVTVRKLVDAVNTRWNTPPLARAVWTRSRHATSILWKLALIDQAKTEPEDNVSYADHITFRVRLPEAYYLPELVKREIAVMEEHMVLCGDQYTAADVEHANHYLEQLGRCLADLNLAVSGMGNA